VDILVSLPRGYKAPNFATFYGEDGKPTMKHISGMHPHLKLKLAKGKNIYSSKRKN